MIYADYNATAPVRPEARAAMMAALDAGANPSSVHGPGRAARKLLETARSQVAVAIGARAQDIVFTSGGTEASALALNGVVAQLAGKCTLLVSAIEHEAVTKNAGYSGVAMETAYVTSDGVLDLDWLRERLARWDAARDGMPVLALMMANNETGVLQPVAEAATLVREAGGLTHCDAVQGLGKVMVNVNLLGVDYLALSAHKVGGPQAEAGITVFGASAERLPQTSNFAIAGFRAETQVMAMDLAGVAVSSGSACSSGKVKRSLVLSAMGVSDDLSASAIRVSFGWNSQPEDFDAVADAWLTVAARVVQSPA